LSDSTDLSSTDFTLAVFVDLGKLSGFVAVESMYFSQRFALGITVQLPLIPKNYPLLFPTDFELLKMNRG